MACSFRNVYLVYAAKVDMAFHTWNYSLPTLQKLTNYNFYANNMIL